MELSSKFSMVNTTTQYQECMSAESRTAAVLREVSKAPSEMQLAISIYIALKFVTTKRQIWNLLSGSGKSRIIPALGLMLLTLGLVRRVHVLIPGAGLLKRDRDEYGDYHIAKDSWSSIYSKRHETALVRIETDDGIVGWGEGQAPVSPRTVQTIVEDLCRPVLLDRDPFDVEYLWYRLYSAMRERGQGEPLHRVGCSVRQSEDTASLHHKVEHDVGWTRQI